MQINKNKKFLLGIVVSLVLCLSMTPVYVQAQGLGGIVDVLQDMFGGDDEEENSNSQEESVGNSSGGGAGPLKYTSYTVFGLAQVSDLCQLIEGIWNLLFAFLIVAVFISIVVAGYLYSMAGVNPSNVNTAKSMLSGAVLGLFLGATSYLILDTIQPTLVTATCKITTVDVGVSVVVPGESGPTPDNSGDDTGGSGNVPSNGAWFNSGLYTGPSAAIGGSTEYHIDSKFSNSLSWEQIDSYWVAMARGYASQGRNIEFSNNGVAGRVFDPNAPQAERIALLRSAAAAHAPRAGVYSFDYYIPTRGTDRFSSSVEGAQMILPVVPGGRVTYESGGGYGNYAVVTDSSGNVVYRTGHGDDRRTLPTSRSL